MSLGCGWFGEVEVVGLFGSGCMGDLLGFRFWLGHSLFVWYMDWIDGWMVDFVCLRRLNGFRSFHCLW